MANRMAHRMALILVVFGLSSGTHATAQDLGDFLKKAASDTLRKQVAPENIGKLANGLVQDKQGEPFTVKTQDGWTLVAHRYRPTVAPKPGAAPVILCHGLSYNAMFWDLDPSCSLPNFLAARGYDVWVVSLRGCGMSQKWVWKIDEASNVVVGSMIRKLSRGKLTPTGYATTDPKYANWTLDHHIAYDVPAFVRLVRNQTKAPEVTWIGHSMGGIVALGHLARYQNPGIGKLITVGSQMTMPQGQLVLQLTRELLLTRESQLAGQLDSRQLVEQTKTSVNNLFFNEQHVLPKVYEALSTYAKDVPAIGLLQQYSVMGQTGELLDARKQYNYAKNLGNVKVPIFISCGEADQLAPPVVQRYLYDHVGSTDKTLVLIGKSNGFAVNAGHNDSLVGTTSRQQLYPILVRWIEGAR